MKTKTIKEITREMFSYCETATMSSKKDGLVNIGGLIVTRNDEFFTYANQMAIVHEGFITYGGMSGRDMEALAVGLQEACTESYLEYRINQVKYLGDRLKEKGIPIVEPTGGHGVYVDGRRFFPHIPQHEFRRSGWSWLSLRKPASVLWKWVPAPSVPRILLPANRSGLPWKPCVSAYPAASTQTTILTALWTRSTISISAATRTKA